MEGTCIKFQGPFQEPKCLNVLFVLSWKLILKKRGHSNLVYWHSTMHGISLFKKRHKLSILIKWRMSLSRCPSGDTCLVFGWTQDRFRRDAIFSCWGTHFVETSPAFARTTSKYRRKDLVIDGRNSVFFLRVT
jgi:hypothetical protein